MTTIVRRIDESSPLQYGQVAYDAEAVDASGGTDFTPSTGSNGSFDALYVGGAAARNVAVQTMSGNSVTFLNVPAGTILPIKGKKVLKAASGTTALANEILALYS